MKSSIFVLDKIKGVFWPFKVARRILLTQTVESKTEFEFCCWPCSSFPVVFILFVYITQSEFYLAINGKTETSCPLRCVLNCLCLFSFCLFCSRVRKNLLLRILPGSWHQVILSTFQFIDYLFQDLHDSQWST